MGRFTQWWQRLRGGGQPARVVGTKRRAAPPGAPAETDGELEIAPDPRPVRRASKMAAAGFDPYSSDGGYAKPHSWERVDHD